ncbi:transglutaminase-like domain-containing protein [Prosthecobacter fusiformis]|nr:transglutaminase family protein [Prosthecobacter fusiformis]
MRFQITCELDYTATAPVIFLLNIRPKINSHQMLTDEKFTLVPQMPHVQHTDPVTGNRFDQITAQLPGVYHIRYQVIVETSALKLSMSEIPDMPLGEFELDVLALLYPSRYCQSDRLGNLAAKLFGEFETPLKQVQAIVKWISSHIDYVSGSTTSTTSSEDTLVERQGVCRDFAHLGIALCRALNIPARYFTGYAHELNPPDFHACFETWVGGRWLLWDATGLSSPDAVVHIGTGRDAADVSVCTSFGYLQLDRQTVICQALDPDYRKLSEEELQQVCISHS